MHAFVRQEFWREYDATLLATDRFNICVETTLGLAALLPALRSQHADIFLCASLPSICLNLALLYAHLTRPRAELARWLQASLSGAWALRLLAWVFNTSSWKFTHAAVPGHLWATVLRLLLPGPIVLAAVALGQRLPFHKALVLQVISIAVLVVGTSPRIIPVLEDAAGDLALRVCESMETAVHLVLCTTIPGWGFTLPMPVNTCATHAARHMLFFFDFYVGAVLPLALLLHLEQRAFAAFMQRRLQQGAGSAELLQCYQLELQSVGVQCSRRMQALGLVIVTVLLWSLVCWL